AKHHIDHHNDDEPVDPAAAHGGRNQFGDVQDASSHTRTGRRLMPNRDDHNRKWRGKYTGKRLQRAAEPWPQRCYGILGARIRCLPSGSPMSTTGASNFRRAPIRNGHINTIATAATATSRSTSDGSIPMRGWATWAESDVSASVGRSTTPASWSGTTCGST